MHDRTSIERPDSMAKGNFIIGSITNEQILQAVDMTVTMPKNGHQGVAAPDCTNENVSTKVIKNIQSCTAINNRMVWRKE